MDFRRGAGEGGRCVSEGGECVFSEAGGDAGSGAMMAEHREGRGWGASEQAAN